MHTLVTPFVEQRQVSSFGLDGVASNGRPIMFPRPYVRPSKKKKGHVCCTKRRMHRRVFCRQTCQAVSIVALGPLLESCSGGPTSPSGGSAPVLPVVTGTSASGVITVAVGADSPLATVGGAALVQASAGMFLTVRTGQDTVNAMTAVCTHESCTVTGFANQAFVCPCHGSQYSTSGAVVNGPATRSLQRFNTVFTNNVLTITL